MEELKETDYKFVSKDEKFWTDVLEARKTELAVTEQNIVYLKAVIEMAEKKLKENEKLL